MTIIKFTFSHFNDLLFFIHFLVLYWSQILPFKWVNKFVKRTNSPLYKEEKLKWSKAKQSEAECNGVEKA